MVSNVPSHNTLMSLPIDIHSWNPSATTYKFTDTMADIFSKQSVWKSEFLIGVAKDSSFLGCYAMSGPSGMIVEVAPEG
jgi:hypothetical protein